MGGIAYCRICGWSIVGPETGVLIAAQHHQDSHAAELRRVSLWEWGFRV